MWTLFLVAVAIAPASISRGMIEERITVDARYESRIACEGFAAAFKAGLGSGYKVTGECRPENPSLPSP